MSCYNQYQATPKVGRQYDLCGAQIMCRSKIIKKKKTQH